MNTFNENSMYDDVEEYLSDHPDEAIDLARMFGYDWTQPYEGIDDLFGRYFGGDLVDIIDAFVDNGFSADSYERYYVDEYKYATCIYTENTLDEMVERHVDEVANSIIHEVENGNMQFLKDQLSDDLYKIVCSAFSFEDMISVCWNEVKQELKNTVIKSDDMPEQILGKTRYCSELWEVCDYLEESRFCGVPEELYGKLNCEGLVESIVLNYNVDYNGFGNNMLTLKKYAEMYIQMEFGLGVYR